MIGSAAGTVTLFENFGGKVKKIKTSGVLTSAYEMFTFWRSLPCAHFAN